MKVWQLTLTSENGLLVGKIMIRRVVKCVSFRDCTTTDKLLLALLLIFYVSIFSWSTKDMPAIRDHTSRLQSLTMPTTTAGYDESHPYRYALPYNRSVVGLEFNVDHALLQSLLVPKDRYITLTLDNVEDFVFATGSSAPFYPMLEEAVASIQHHRPKNKILVYDLGLAEDQVKKVKTWCNVVHKKFNFTDFPPHVKRLVTYAWKPLIMMDVLKEYQGVLWMDSSVRVITSDFTGLFRDVVHNKGGISLTTSGHSTFAATHPGMYKYLPTDMEAIKREEQREATLMFYRTQEMYDSVLRWLTMCALDRDCIAPTLRRTCEFRGDNRRRWGQCHRFDQSAVNILFSNYFNYDSWNYYAKTRVVKIERYVSGEYRVQESNCSPQKRKMAIKAKLRKGQILLPKPVYKRFV